ncbi:hypothetical protein Pfo_016982 [Paulownia fortunei]|nr:hypothetical protein Pfo_016982 [Paulownia fortunei]
MIAAAAELHLVCLCSEDWPGQSFLHIYCEESRLCVLIVNWCGSLTMRMEGRNCLDCCIWLLLEALLIWVLLIGSCWPIFSTGLLRI